MGLQSTIPIFSSSFLRVSISTLGDYGLNLALNLGPVVSFDSFRHKAGAMRTFRAWGWPTMPWSHPFAFIFYFYFIF